ncbi:unnamed protein product, partial [Laminaria digitata]
FPLKIIDSSPTFVVTQVRHIVCVKPNQELSPVYLDSESLLRQLSTTGVLAVARMESLSLPSGRRVNK